MSVIRTPVKMTFDDTDSSPPLTKTMTQATNVRKSIGEWEATRPDAPQASTHMTKAAQPCPARIRQKPAQSQESKTTARRASNEVTTSPPKQIKYVDKTAEARACLQKAKLHLSNSKNLKTDIRNEVTQAIDRLYNIVKELEKEKNGKMGNETGKTSKERKETVEQSDLQVKMEEHTRMLRENSRKIDELRVVIEDKMTYANVTATKVGKRSPERSAFHSLVVTSEKETDTGETVLNKVREAIDAKQGWVKVSRVRKAKDCKIIMSCDSKEEREKVRNRLATAGKHLIVEDVKNKDPLIILKDVLLVNSDEDVLKAMRNQNRAIFRDLDEEENRIAIKYRRKARNPHTGHIVVSTSPKIWRRAVDAGALHIDLQLIRVADQSPLVQCSRCLSYGHSKRFCKETVDLCGHCGGPHLRANCPEWLAGTAPVCRNCTKAELGRTDHDAFGQECPIRKRWDLLARSAIAYC